MLLEEQAVSITGYMEHGPWSCQTFYADAWNSRMMRSDPWCYSKQRKKHSFCSKLTSTGTTTGTETCEWSYGSSLCSGCQQSPGNLVSWKNTSKIADNRQMLFSILHQGHPYPYSWEPFWAALGKVSESCCSKSEKKFLRLFFLEFNLDISQWRLDQQMQIQGQTHLWILD